MITNPNARITQATWEERGPGNVTGLSRQAWVNPGDTTHSTWLAAAEGGGVWRTVDKGKNWEVLTDHLPVIGISSIMGSKADPMVIYAGIGSINNDLSGSGILKTTDGGTTWDVLPSTLGNAQFSNVRRIAVDQTDPNNIIAVTNPSDFTSFLDEIHGYIMKSTDGGASWKEVYKHTYALGLPSIGQVIASWNSFDTLFATINGGNIIRSTDMGDTWEEMLNLEDIRLLYTTDAEPIAPENAFVSRVEVAIAPTNPNHIFAAIAGGGGYTELYPSLLLFSADKGATWAKVLNGVGLAPLDDWFGGQGFHNDAISVHPFDSKTVYVGGAGPILRFTLDEKVDETTYRATLTVVTDGYGAFSHIEGVDSKGVHVDHHQFIFIPIDRGAGDFYILNMNDGGLAFSEDGGETFTQTGDTFKQDFISGDVYPTFRGPRSMQFYGVDKQNGADRYVAGSQDNGSWVSPSETDIESIWAMAPSGDGFQAAWHYTNPNLLLESSQFNEIAKSIDGGETWLRAAIPTGAGPFVTVIENSKQDPDMVCVVNSRGVFTSVDFAETWYGTDMPADWRFSGFYTPVAISLVDPAVIWSGTGVSQESRIALSTSQGINWTSTSAYTPAELGRISGINTHPTDKNTAYAVLSQAKSPKILRTTDLGQTWEDISGFDNEDGTSTRGFPDVATYCVLVMPFDTQMLWAGTDIGIIESTDGGESWHLLAEDDFPAVIVWQMRIINDQVVIATHGRGIWTATLPELAGYSPPPALLSPRLSGSSSTFSHTIELSYDLRAAYDSSLVRASSAIFDGEQLIATLPANAAPTSGTLKATITGQITTDTPIEFSITSWKDGSPVVGIWIVKLLALNPPAVVYSNQFGDTDPKEVEHWVFDRFYIDSGQIASIFGSRVFLALSEMGRGPGSSSTALLKVPLILNGDKANVSFSNLALVQPEDDQGVVRDFVAVSAIKLSDFLADPENPKFTTLTQYSSSLYPEWGPAYRGEVDITGLPDLVRKQVVDLYKDDSFSKGDTIILQFSLTFNDDEDLGTGWVVDSLSFVNMDTVVLGLKDNASFAASVYPNPISSTTTLRYEVRTSNRVKIELFTLNGLRLEVIKDAFQTAGTYQIVQDVSNLLPGLYICRLQIGSDWRTMKWLVEK